MLCKKRKKKKAKKRGIQINRFLFKNQMFVMGTIEKGNFRVKKRDFTVNKRQ